MRGSIEQRENHTPGISLSIRLDENLAAQYKSYVADPDLVNGVPIEYYEVVWLSFGNDPLSARSIPVKPILIDPSSISNSYAANKYVLEAVRDYLTKEQSVDLALAYRRMRDEFQEDKRITAINLDFFQKGIVSEKALSISMDTTTRASWETGVSRISTISRSPLLARVSRTASRLSWLSSPPRTVTYSSMEEPENHLSHANLGKLVSHLATRCIGKQVIVSTHSSFVLNKLGIDSVIMFDGNRGVTLDHLPPDTKSYFQRLPGHDTLRMILAERSILVEGPSDELIVQRGFRQRHGVLPLEAGVEVICRYLIKTLFGYRETASARRIGR